MAVYGYEVIDKSGKITKGSINADSIEMAKMDLKRQGLTLVKIVEQTALTRDINIDFGSKPTARI